MPCTMSKAQNFFHAAETVDFIQYNNLLLTPSVCANFVLK
jgi:hypothetical protein